MERPCAVSDEPPEYTVGAFVRRAASRWPQSRIEFPNESLSFAELDARADQMARLVIAAGGRPGEHAGLLLEPCGDFIALLTGIARAGLCAVPLNERFKSRELSYVIGHADMAILFTSDRTAEHVDFPALVGEALTRAPAPALRRTVLFGAPRDGFTSPAGLAGSAAAIPAQEMSVRAAGARPQHGALVMYTSGTSAMPKGCVISHDAFTAQGRAIGEHRYFLAPGDAFWCPLPLFHNGGLATLMACLATGATYVHAGHFEPGVAIDQLERHRCTHAIPAFETIWLRVLDHPRFSHADLGGLRIVLNAGTAARLRQLQARLPAVTQLANYGCTEGSGHVSINLPSDPPEVRINTGGHPLPGMEARIVDPATGTERGPGEVGEILFRGRMRFSGYHKAPEATAEAIDADGWFHSSDLGFLDEEGRLAYVGRLKDMLKVGGENVAAAEVEALLIGHPAVGIAAVVGAPDARYDEVPVAFIELAPGATCGERELIDWCLGQIATFKVPRYVRFVTEWPMSGTKIQKFVLRESIERELRERGITEAPALSSRRGLPAGHRPQAGQV